jgi:hypothetical protein
MKSFLSEQLAGVVSFLNAFFGKIDISPSRKTVFLIPNALSVANKTTFFIFFELFVDE